MKYIQLHDGLWFTPVMRGLRLICCDCGLVHSVDFKITKAGVKMRATRNARATAAARRSKHYETLPH